MKQSEMAVRRQRMARAVKGGADIGKLATAEGVCVETVRRACRESGVRYGFVQWGPGRGKPRGSLKKKLLRILASLLEEPRATEKEIGRIHDVTRQQVSHVAREARQAGIKISARR